VVKTIVIGETFFADIAKDIAEEQVRRFGGVIKKASGVDGLYYHEGVDSLLLNDCKDRWRWEGFDATISEVETHGLPIEWHEDGSVVDEYES